MSGLSKPPSPPSAIPAIPVGWPPPFIAEHGPRTADLKRDTKLGGLGLRAASLAAVEGTVERLSSGTARTTKLYVDCTYAVHGVPERDQEEISSREYAHLPVGDHVPITALLDPNEEGRSRPLYSLRLAQLDYPET